MMKNNIEVGDLVSHVALPKTLGIAYEKHSIEQYTFVEVFWLHHPDVEQYGNHSVMHDKYIRPFKPWRGFYDTNLTSTATDATLEEK